MQGRALPESRGRASGASPLSLDAARGDGFDEGTLGEEVEDEQGGDEHQRGGRNHLLLIAHRRAAGKPQLNGNVAVQTVGDGRGFKAQELDVPQEQLGVERVRPLPETVVAHLDKSHVCAC